MEEEVMTSVCQHCTLDPRLLFNSIGSIEETLGGKKTAGPGHYGSGGPLTFYKEPLSGPGKAADPIYPLIQQLIGSGTSCLAQQRLRRVCLAY
ncbi:hypothetical protein J6590_051589 [Homalodisca vitripennis]|nr:hypothetical protein J6590_051589 [Homalodisca vitripennis]